MPKVVDVAARRAELADAAARLIARSGVEAATMREVAAEAGLTTGALTHYFADKRALLLHTYQQSLEERRWARERAVADDPEQSLVAALEAGLPTDEMSRLHWKVTVALSAQAGADEELRSVQRDAYRAHHARMQQRLAAAGYGPPTATAALADRLTAMVNGIALQALFDPDGWPAARQLATLQTAVAALLTTT